MMKIAVVGLGKMGEQIARKLHEGGFSVIAHSLHGGTIDEMKSLGMIPAYTKEEVKNAFGKDRAIIWLMLPADLIDAELNFWLNLVPKGSVIIDGGNSDFRVTKVRAKEVLRTGSTFIDVGTSGGVWGYKNGFSMMIGGDEKTFKDIEPIFGALTKPEGKYARFGESGAGHYVKMIHNAVEYGMMESLAEGYRLLKQGPYANMNLYNVGDVWQGHSIVMSWLNELTRDALKENPELSGVDGYVSETGEARWALETAKDLNIDVPSIRAAFNVRVSSQTGNINFATKLLATMRNAFGGHKINK